MADILSRILGCLYGMACGDAMGVPSSFMSQDYIRKRWGWINTFLPPDPGHIFHDGLKAGEYTDDSEQAIGLMNSFCRNKHVDPYDVVNEIILWAERVKDKYVSPLGPSTARALQAIKAGADITLSGKFANSNGAAMRICPVGVIHGLRKSPEEELVRDVYMTCLPTHNTGICVAGASAIAMGVAVCIQGEQNIETILEKSMHAADLGQEYGYDTSSPLLSRRIELAYSLVKDNTDHKAGMKKLYEYFGGGDLMADTVPAALALFALGKGNFVNVIEYCVNFGGDCDTNGAMAGAMAGAYCGISAAPADWITTIQNVNHIDMKPYAEKLIALSSEWTVAGEAECRKSFFRL